MLTQKVWSFQLIDQLGQELNQQQELSQGFPTGNQPKLQDQPQGIPLKRDQIPIQYNKKSSLRAQRSLPAQQTSQKSQRTLQTNYSRRCLIGGTSETRLTKPTRRGHVIRSTDRERKDTLRLTSIPQFELACELRRLACVWLRERGRRRFRLRRQRLKPSQPNRQQPQQSSCKRG